MKLSIVITSYNEKGAIEELIRDSYLNAKKFFKNYEIIVLDDCSTDGSRELLKQIKNKYKNIKLIFHKKNTGYGGVLLDLYAAAKGDYILNLPGDNQLPASNLGRFLKYKDDYDVIIGYRKNRKDSTLRKIQSFLYNLILSSIIRKRLHDVNSSKLIKRDVIKNIKLETKSSYAEPSAEICLKAFKKGYKIKEVIVEHRPRTYGKNMAGSKTSIFETPFIIAKDIINLWRVVRRYK